MKCLICKQGETHPNSATVPLQRNGTTIIFKGVPADVCSNCGEYYLSEDITGRLLERAEQAVQNGAELEIVRFAE
jgi:YgiT-type zinc finger domain-containing protein